MPIKIDDNLPAAKTLNEENIFVIGEKRAMTQDIRPLKIVILNLMPNKIETETQLLRLLSNTPLQIDITLLQMASHTSKNTSADHMIAFYKTFDEIRDLRFDGMIVTGAPLENIEFEDVDFWGELCEVLDWADDNVYSTFFICWAALAGLYHYYGIKKYPLNQKLSGIYKHTPMVHRHALLRGFDDYYYAPHSRYSEVRMSDIVKHPELDVLSMSKEAGIHIVADRNCRRFFITGHSEYDRDTLRKEYLRDLDRGLDVTIPKSYFPDDIPDNSPILCWRAHANLLFTNWLNYFVYQQTPFDLNELESQSSKSTQK